jgi:hypothetical protein
MQGKVEIVDGPPEMVLDMARRIYARYLKADELASAGEAMLRGSQHVLLHFSPRVIKTWDTTAS